MRSRRLYCWVSVLGLLYILFVVFAMNSFAGFVTLSKDGKSFEKDEVKFYSIGVNAINIKEGKYYAWDQVYDQSWQGEEAWAQEVKDRFSELGLNTVGAFSSEFLNKSLLYTRCIYFGNFIPGALHSLCDVFDPSYKQMADEYAKNDCKDDNENLIGVFIGNEPKIYGGGAGSWKPHLEPLLEIYQKLPSGSPGHERVKQFLIENNKDNNHLSYNKLCDIWAGIVMDQHMKVCVGAIRKYQKHHYLILGVRYASNPSIEMVRAVAKNSDVLSFNLYNNDFSLLDYWHKETGKPIMITEFSFRSLINKSNNQNQNGPWTDVYTDKDRAYNYKKYVEEIQKRPYVIGLHWFQYSDEAPYGRGNSDGITDGPGDSEDSNFGFYSIYNEPYEDLLKQVKESNYIWGSKLK